MRQRLGLLWRNLDSCPPEKLRPRCAITVCGFLDPNAHAPVFCGHGHYSRCLFGVLRRSVLHPASCDVRQDVPLGIPEPQSQGGGKTPGSRKPAVHAQAQNPATKGAQAQVHRGFPALVGLHFSCLGSVAGLGASHATGNGQKLAHESFQILLALEIAKRGWSSSDLKRDAGSDTKAQQGEPVVEPGTDRRHARPAGL